MLLLTAKDELDQMQAHHIQFNSVHTADYIHWAESHALVEFPSEAAVSDAIDEPGRGSSSCPLQTRCQQQHTHSASHITPHQHYQHSSQ